MSSLSPVRRWLLAGAATALLAITAAGCGGGSSSSSSTNDNGGSDTTASSSSTSSTNADKWAESFCTYTSTWETSLKKTATQFKSSSKSTESVNAALDSAKTSTTLFAHQLSALGTPPGAQNASGQLRTYAGRLKSSAENLKGTWSAPTSSASESAQKLAQLAGTLRTISLQLKEAGTYIKSLPSDSPARQALESNSTCKTLFS
jgi:hypothetical protein